MTTTRQAQPETRSEQSDGQLVEAVQAGNTEAYNELVVRYQDRIFNLVRKYVYDGSAAEDVAQSAFIRAYQALESFRAEAKFSTWLYRIAVNEAISWTRKAKRNRAVSLERSGGGSDEEGAMQVPDDNHDPGDRVDQAEAREVVHEAINRLGEEYRMVILLREIEECSYDEIAEILELPIGTVRSRIYRGRQELRETLADYAGTFSREGASKK